MALSLEQPLKATEGSRILLMSGERVVGLGAVTQIGH
jgi:translation elongation factor EF-Tu-like GTPase